MFSSKRKSLVFSDAQQGIFSISESTDPLLDYVVAPMENPYWWAAPKHHQCCSANPFMLVPATGLKTDVSPIVVSDFDNLEVTF